MEKLTTIKKDYKNIGEQFENDYDYKQKAIATELYYESGKGYFVTARALVVSTNKERGYQTETTCIFRDGYHKALASAKRKSKAGEEEAIKFYNENKDKLIELCELSNPEYATF